MHLSVNWQHMTGLKTVLPGEGLGGLGCTKQRLTDPLYLMIWGPRLHDCVVLSRHSRLSEKKPPPLWDRNNIHSLDQIAANTVVDIGS